MLTERLTFRAKYGHGDELVALFKEQAPTLTAGTGATGVRMYTDTTGPMFSVIAEIDYPDVTTWAAGQVAERAEYADPAFQQWFARMMAVTESGDRQLLNSEKLI